MSKQELIKTFYNNHIELLDYINDLPDNMFTYSYNGKWTAGQQLNHAYLCLLPFTKALVSKESILQNFGKITREKLSYDEVMESYLKTSLKAPSNFLPDAVNPSEKPRLNEDLKKSLSTISKLLAEFSETELDLLALPHPLMGKLSIREMFFLMIYHPTHHLEKTKINLRNYKM